MNKKELLGYVFTGLAVILALVAGYFGITLPYPPLPPDVPDLEPLASQVQALSEEMDGLRITANSEATSFSITGDDSYQTACYTKQGGSEMVADDGCTFGVLSGGIIEVQSGGTLDIQSGAGITLAGYLTSTIDSLTVTGNTLITGNLTLAALLLPGFADATITDGETLTPTVTAYALDSAGAVTMTLGAVGTDGQLLILMGDDNNTITIADTNIRTSDGNAITLGQYDTVAFVYQDNEWLQLLKSANQ